MTLCCDPLLVGLEPLLAVPEFKVPLPGGDRASQNGIFVLARSASGPVSIMVEGKVNESFGPTVEEWRAEDSCGKKTKLAFLLRKLGLPRQIDGAVCYQLLHRTASAVIEGERYRAAAAMLLVHSFSAKQAGWSDYRKFLTLFGVEAESAGHSGYSGSGLFCFSPFGLSATLAFSRLESVLRRRRRACAF